ncbi:hypothetical protein SDC9_149648 [bioreactor metagenome]|uniref:Uncharacterized protein n=1 Tax=bioreactor metagenome TaxID=1076179 RepID=A0A645EMD1_9ZZZZ
MVTVEILLDGIDPDGQRERLEEAEQRSQLVVDHQCMAVTAAGGRKQHGHVCQRLVVHKIEQMLEQPRIRSAIHRTGHDEQIGRFNRRDVGFHCGGQLAAIQRARELRPHIAQFHHTHVHSNLLAERGDQFLDQHQRARGTLQIAGYGNDFQLARHFDITPELKPHSASGVQHISERRASCLMLENQRVTKNQQHLACCIASTLRTDCCPASNEAAHSCPPQIVHRPTHEHRAAIRGKGAAVAARIKRRNLQ